MLMFILYFTVMVTMARSATLPPNPRNEYQDPRPYGSNKPCSVLVNETLSQNGDQILVERILMTSDSAGSSFSSSSAANQQLDNWSNRVCGQLENLVGYLRQVCQFSSSSTDPLDIAAQMKLRAMYNMKDYLCSNNEVNLKEMAFNNGAQCARRTDMADFGCNNPTGVSSSGPFLPPNRPVVRYATEVILSPSVYNSDSCRFITDVTNCILDKYTRRTDICSSRVSSHMSKIVQTMLQSVQCSSGSSFNTANNFNNPSFGQGSFGQSGNNFGQGSGGFGQSSSSSGFGQGSGGFGQSSSSSGFGQGSGGFGQSSSSSFGQSTNRFGQDSSFGQGGSGGFGQNNNFGQSSNNAPWMDNLGRTTTNTVPPWGNNRRSNGNIQQAAAALIFPLIMLPCLIY